MEDSEIPAAIEDGEDVALQMLATITGGQQVARPSVMTVRRKSAAHGSGVFTADEDFHACFSPSRNERMSVLLAAAIRSSSKAVPRVRPSPFPLCFR